MNRLWLVIALFALVGCSLSVSSPFRPSSDITPVQAISVANNYTCSLNDTNEMDCWGKLPWRNVEYPIQVNGVQTLASSSTQTCILANGQVQCWGGDSVPNLENPRLLTASVYSACALTDHGTQCWGNGLDSAVDRLPMLQAPTKIAAGFNDGTSFICGLENNKIACSAGLRVPSEVGSVKDLIVSWGEVCALTDNGVLCWSASNDLAATRFTNFSVQNPSGVAVGNTFYCVFNQDEIQCPSDRGAADLVPRTHFDGLRQVSAGEDHVCVLDKAGEVFCWGANRDGESETPWKNTVCDSGPKDLVTFEFPLADGRSLSIYGDSKSYLNVAHCLPDHRLDLIQGRNGIERIAIGDVKNNDGIYPRVKIMSEGQLILASEYFTRVDPYANFVLTFINANARLDESKGTKPGYTDVYVTGEACPQPARVLPEAIELSRKKEITVKGRIGCRSPWDYHPFYVKFSGAGDVLDMKIE